MNYGKVWKVFNTVGGLEAGGSVDKAIRPDFLTLVRTTPSSADKHLVLG